MSMATFSGWSIRSTGTNNAEWWRIYEGDTMPELVAFLTPLDISSGTVPTTITATSLHPGTSVNTALLDNSSTPTYSVQYSNAQRLAGNQFLGYDLIFPVTSTQVYLDLVPTSGSSYTSVYGTAPSLNYVYDTSATYNAADVVSSSLVVPVGTPGSTGAPVFNCLSAAQKQMDRKRSSHLNLFIDINHVVVNVVECLIQKSSHKEGDFIINQKLIRK